MATDYSFAAILEFDDREGLQAYLDHDVHGRGGERRSGTRRAELWDTNEGIERIRGVV